jgi:hypothetical protein
MIRSVGIDLSCTGSHQVHCLDERAMPCDGFSVDTSLEGLEKLEERIFSNGSCPTIVFEPTGLALGGQVRDLLHKKGSRQQAIERRDSRSSKGVGL